MTVVNNLKCLMSSIFARSHLLSNGDLCGFLLLLPVCAMGSVKLPKKCTSQLEMCTHRVQSNDHRNA